MRTQTKTKSINNPAEPEITRPEERRKAKRFAIELELRYKTIGKREEPLIGFGKTVNISSSGVLFTCEQKFVAGTRLELSICWPAQLNEHCSLNLVARGCVARSERDHLALRVDRYEFRTRSTIVSNNKLAQALNS